MPNAERRVIVCGSRDYADRDFIDFTLEKLFLAAHTHDERLVIVTGACPTGADYYAKLAVERAIARGENVRIEEHPADWNALGKSAGPARNSRLALLGAGACIAFWDGSSPGTLDMIEKSVRRGIAVLVPTRTNMVLVALLMQQLVRGLL
jgi:hypothetical protein